MSKLHKIFCTLPEVIARTSSDDNAIRYVLPVLWMTVCLPITGHTARAANMAYRPMLKATHQGAGAGSEV